ncbi:MAG: sugar kinase [Flavobacteriales bacterium MED-G15]|nr:MAG: sugar kinase [Flavobacteriales bacterium MED-G15]|tara:strand:+ start:34374 stop:35303 length:930 start_codon:yes stop_codon:yes gene_type:complete
MNNKLLIVGTMAYDAIETPFGKVDKILGGAATYIGLSASQFSLDCAIISVVGEDFEEQHLELLRRKGIDLSGVEIVSGGETFFWSGKYHNDLNTRMTMETRLNVLENFNPIIPDHLRTPDIVMLGNLSPDVQFKALEQLKNKPKLIVLDTMNFWMEHFRSRLDEVIAKVDLISINDEEARQLTGEYSLVKAAEKIHELGPQYIIIKKGEHGALLFHDSKIFCAPALPLEEVFDPTGAGDSFAGGFTGYLTQTGDISFRNMKSAVIYASAMASFTVEKFGTESLINYSSHSMDNRLKAFKELTTFDIEIQ